jgi:hypothetical protein
LELPGLPSTIDAWLESPDRFSPPGYPLQAGHTAASRDDLKATVASAMERLPQLAAVYLTMEYTDFVRWLVEHVSQGAPLNETTLLASMAIAAGVHVAALRFGSAWIASGGTSKETSVQSADVAATSPPSEDLTQALLSFLDTAFNAHELDRFLASGRYTVVRQGAPGAVASHLHRVTEVVQALFRHGLVDQELCTDLTHARPRLSADIRRISSLIQLHVEHGSVQLA